MKKTIAILLVSGASLAWCADTASIGGPVSGYVVDGRFRSIRPIEGIPGAARLGDPIDLPFPIGVAAMSAPQDYAIVTAAKGNGVPLLARGLRSRSPQVSAIDRAITVSGVAVAQSGASAALYSDAQLQFVDGLPAAPNASDPVDLGSLNGVVFVALDAAGRNAVLLARDGNVFFAARGAGVKWVASVPGASSAGFLPSGDDAVVASADTGDVILLRGLSGALSIRTVAGSANGLDSVRSVRAIDASQIAVVDGLGRLGAVDVETGAVNWIALAGAADRIDSLDSGLLVLNQPGSQPLLLLDTTQGQAPYFVPPDSRGVLRRRNK